jgi:hypothetical protein
MTKTTELKAKIFLLLPISMGIGLEQIDDLAEANPIWFDMLSEKISHVNTADVIHDVVGLMAKDEHFLPRI